MGGDPDLSVTCRDLQLLLVEIKSELAAMRDQMGSHIEKVEKIHADHEQRLRTNEQFRWAASGVLAFLGVLGGWLGIALAKGNH